MITSKHSLRSGFDCIIRTAPSGAGRTTPSQPGHYPPNTKFVLRMKLLKFHCALQILVLIDGVWGNKNYTNYKSCQIDNDAFLYETREW